MATTLLYATPWVLIALALAACGAPAMNSGGAPASDAPKTAATSAPAGIQLPPCRQDFNARDTNADQFISLEEWLKSEQGKTFIQAPEAAFAQKDTNKDGQLSPQEFGCDF